MKTLFKSLFAFLLVCHSFVAAAEERLKVVASFTDLADIARNIGGDFIDVQSIATGVEDPHAVPMKPSFAVLLSRADVLIVQGLDLEHAFLPALLEASRNSKIQRDTPGYIDCSAGITPLKVPTRLDRSLGDQHPSGNPHFNLDPVSGKAIARTIAEGLSRIDPEHAAIYEKNLAAYLSELDRWIAKWSKEAAPLKGIRFVSYHPDFEYFADRFGMIPSGTIEIRAGVDPTPSHIAELEEQMKQLKVPLVVRERHYPAQLAQTVATATGAKLVELPIMTGGVPEATDYIHFIDYNVRTLLAAIAETK